MPEGAPSLVGRASELRELTDALQRGDAGVVVAGAAGLGKTALASAFLRDAAADDCPTRWVTATRTLASTPLGAFAGLFASVPLPVGSPSELLVRAVSALETLGGDRQLVLVVDDVHLLDPTSAGLVQLSAMNGSVFVVATTRTGEPEPDGIRALWKDGRAVRLELGPLGRAAVGELVESLVGGPVEADTASRLWQVSQGSPLFVQELVATGRQGGALAARHGVWTWTGEFALGLRLAEVLADRLGGLDDAERRILELIALSEPIDVELLRPEVDDGVLEQLESCGFITCSDAGRGLELRVAHPLYAEGLRSSLPPLRRRHAFRQLATMLGARGTPCASDELRMAHWQLEAGTALDAGRLADAARQALTGGDRILAEQLARGALRLEPHRGASLTLAHSLQHQGRYGETRDVLAAVELDGSPPNESVEHAIVNSDNLLFGLGNVDDARAALMATEERLGPGPEQARLVAHRATLEAYSGRMPVTLAITEELLAGPEQDPEARLRALSIRTSCLAVGGWTAAACEAGEQAIQLVTQFGLGPVVAGFIRAALATARRLAGDLDGAHGLAAGTSEPELAGRSGWASMLLGEVALDRGQVQTAARHLREARVLLAGDDATRVLVWVLAGLTRAEAQRNAVAAATAVLEAASGTLAVELGWLRSEMRRAEAWLAAASGDIVRARRLACAAATDASGKRERMFEVLALHDALRLGEHRVAARLARIASEMDGAVAPLYAAHARAVRDGDAGGLTAVAEQFADLGMFLLAAR